MLRKLFTIAAAIARSGGRVRRRGVPLLWPARSSWTEAARRTSAFVETAEQQAARVERHRAAQRAQAPPPAPSAETAPNVRRVFSIRAGGHRARTERPRDRTANASTATRLILSPARAACRNRTGRTSAARSATASTPERPILVNWPAAGLKPMWKQPAGAGYASFVDRAVAAPSRSSSAARRKSWPRTTSRPAASVDQRLARGVP